MFEITYTRVDGTEKVTYFSEAADAADYFDLIRDTMYIANNQPILPVSILKAVMINFNSGEPFEEIISSFNGRYEDHNYTGRIIDTTPWSETITSNAVSREVLVSVIAQEWNMIHFSINSMLKDEDWTRHDKWCARLSTICSVAEKLSITRQEMIDSLNVLEIKVEYDPRCDPDMILHN